MTGSFHSETFALRFRRKRLRPAAGEARTRARFEEVSDADAALTFAGVVSCSQPVVLVVDPGADTRRFIISRLGTGYRVVTAGDGREGYLAALRDPPDLVLAAVSMPAMDGPALCAAIKDNPGSLGEVPVILMASRAELARLSGEGRDADEYLVKPFDAAELIARVGTLIRLRALERQLAETAARMDLIMDNVPAGIVLLKPIPGGKPDFLITAVNKNVNKVAGFTQQFLYPGGRLSECLRPAAAHGMYGECDIERRIAERMAWYASRPEETITSVFPTVDDRFVNASRSPHSDFGFLVVTVDASEQVRTERALKAARDQAENALEDLLAAQNRLIQAEKLASLGRLVAGVAHEINTPLGIAVTMASLLFERVGELTVDLEAGRLRRRDLERYVTGAREGCELMLANLRRAADLVHSFRQVAADQVSDERHTFELCEWLSDTVVSLGPVWRKAGHRVEIDCPEPIELDGYSGVISQILTNLVMNSIVHGFDPGQSGVLTIAATRIEDDRVELSYTDDGKGIASATLDKVFDPFFTTRRNSGSTGLGLHIIYNLVTGKLGGSIDLESQEGRGVRFVLRFPRVLAPEAPEAPPPG